MKDVDTNTTKRVKHLLNRNFKVKIYHSLASILDVLETEVDNVPTLVKVLEDKVMNTTYDKLTVKIHDSIKGKLPMSFIFVTVGKTVSGFKVYEEDSVVEVLEVKSYV